MDIQPGQLVIAKSDFEASEIPIDWADEKRLPRDQRTTLRHVKIKKNEILFITEQPVQDTLFLRYGPGTTMIRKMVTFLRGSSLCFMVTVVGFEDYLEPIDYSDATDSTY